MVKGLSVKPVKGDAVLFWSMVRLNLFVTRVGCFLLT